MYLLCDVSGEWGKYTHARQKRGEGNVLYVVAWRKLECSKGARERERERDSTGQITEVKIDPREQLPEFIGANFVTRLAFVT